MTLWAPIDKAIEKLQKAKIDLSENTSKIAVFGTLYGEGFKILLRNLLYNPQIDLIVIFGLVYNESNNYLEKFFRDGVESVQSKFKYLCKNESLKPNTVRIVGTNYIMDDLVEPDTFLNIPNIFTLEDFSDSSAKEIEVYLSNYRFRAEALERIYVELPEVLVESYPSNIRSHVVVEKSISKAWKKVVQRVFRFGQRVAIQKGDRIEIQNLKVVIEEPRFEEHDVITEMGYDPLELINYQNRILSSEKSSSTYSYGHRLRKYFGIDMIQSVVEELKGNIDDRKAFISLWDNATDMKRTSSPCLISLFFRKEIVENCEVIHLTATYRSHNVAKAWYENVYGLRAIQKYVAESIGACTGAITVFSHSISLDPSYLDRAKIICDNANTEPIFREDPNGYFRITTEEESIIVQHYSLDNIKIGEYKNRSALRLQRLLAKENAISDINHAIYVGRQLQKAYNCIKNRTKYIQD